MDGWPDRSFQYYVRCEDDNLEDNLIYEINKIYTSARPNNFIMLFSQIGLLSWVIFILFYIVIYFVQDNQYIAPVSTMIRTKIYQILSKEELVIEDYLDIIKYKTIYDLGFYSLMENDELTIVRNKFIKLKDYYIKVGILLCIIISINPRATFAAGRNKSKVKIWRYYYKFIYYTILEVIILQILINFISQIIAEKF